MGRKHLIPLLQKKSEKTAFFSVHTLTKLSNVIADNETD